MFSMKYQMSKAQTYVFEFVNNDVYMYLYE